MMHRSPDFETLLSRANTAYGQGDWDTATEIYFQALSISPNSFPVLANLGMIYFSKAQWPKAVLYLEKALVINPEYALLQYNLAVSYHQQANFPAATKAYHQTLLLDPSCAEAYSNLGVILKAQGQLEEAIQSLQKAVELKPDYAEAFSNLGLAFKTANRYQEAQTCLELAVKLNPAFAGAYYNLGLVFQAQDNLENAIASYKTALELNPEGAEIYNSLGSALYYQGKLDEAIEHYQKALTLQPVYPEAYSNLGVAFKENGQLDEAIQAYQEALRLKPDYADAGYSLALALLLRGDYCAGWSAYGWRFKARPAEYLTPMLDVWDGATQVEGELLLLAEQGIGDLIQFMRYGQQLKNYCNRLLIDVHPSLVALAESTQIFDAVIALPLPQTFSRSAKSTYLLDVPRILGVSYRNPLITVPYLQAQPERVTHWREKIRQGDELVIGLNWQGNPNTETNDFIGRSFKLEQYKPLSTIPGVRFVSLQKGYGAEQLANCTFKNRFVECQGEIEQSRDWMETLAIIENCDLIITSDTSIAHAAGALGKPVWVLLKKVPDWRWGLAGETCPWYPSARLFRQTRREDWRSVMALVKSELQSFQPAE